MATKKSTKKGVKKASGKASSSRGNTYQLTATGAKHLADVSGQGALIRDAVAKHGPLTAASIVERIGSALKSATPAKNVAFYLCVWKSDGFIKFGPKR